MSDYSDNNKRLVKNTTLLYFRMLLTMGITLYTSRVVLRALGVEDYGIYDLVGGLVALFSVISSTLSVAINRFITYELGAGNQDKLNKVFSTSINIQILVILILIITSETLGLWYLNHKMVIPIERLNAANWCFQFSIVTFAVNLINVPYNATIIAHERMSAFAYIAIIESIGQLFVAWGIMVTPYDRLISYSIYMTLFAVIIRVIYIIYCRRNFEECSYHFVFDISLMKQMFGFVGWAFIGVSAWGIKRYGSIILVNLFFGPLVNAAYAISTQVESAINSFSNNFMMALNPQIIKAYAEDKKEYMFKLIYQGARYSSYIMLLISLPLFLDTHFFLVLWLDKVPDHTVLFVKLIVVMTMLNSTGSTLTIAQIATGKIKNYQLVVSPIGLMTIPISYLFFRKGAIPELLVVVSIIVSQVSLIASLIMIHKMIGIGIFDFFREVYLNILKVGSAALALPLLVKILINESFLNSLLTIFLSVGCTIVAVVYIGMSQKERQFLYFKANQLVVRLRRI